MSLIDKIAASRDEPDDRDLLEYFGIAGSEFAMTKDGVTIGNETVSLADARRALHGVAPGRTVQIGDLLEHDEARTTEQERE